MWHVACSPVSAATCRLWPVGCNIICQIPATFAIFHFNVVKQLILEKLVNFWQHFVNISSKLIKFRQHFRKKTQHFVKCDFCLDLRVVERRVHSAFSCQNPSSVLYRVRRPGPPRWNARGWRWKRRRPWSLPPTNWRSGSGARLRMKCNYEYLANIGKPFNHWPIQKDKFEN